MWWKKCLIAAGRICMGFLVGSHGQFLLSHIQPVKKKGGIKENIWGLRWRREEVFLRSFPAVFQRSRVSRSSSSRTGPERQLRLQEPLLIVSFLPETLTWIKSRAENREASFHSQRRTRGTLQLGKKLNTACCSLSEGTDRRGGGGRDKVVPCEGKVWERRGPTP